MNRRDLFKAAVAGALALCGVRSTVAAQPKLVDVYDYGRTFVFQFPEPGVPGTQPGHRAEYLHCTKEYARAQGWIA